MSTRTGFARWWRTIHIVDASVWHPDPLRVSAKLGWNACKEAARQAVFDVADDTTMTSHLRAALDRIDRL